MDNGNRTVNRRRVAPERREYEQNLENLANFIDNELGNRRAPRPIPDCREWKIQRTRTIRILKDLKEKLDKVCVGANYGKTVGNGTEIVGAVIAIVGAVMSLFGKSSSEEVANAGKMVQHAGNCINGISSGIESYISEKYLKEIEAALVEDQALSLALAEWLTFSNILEADVQAIFGISLTSGAFGTVMKAFQDVYKLSNSVGNFKDIISHMKQGQYSLYIGNDIKIEKLEQFFQCLSASPKFANKVNRVLNVLNVKTGGVQLCVDGVKAYYGMRNIFSSPTVPTLQGGSNPEIPSKSEVSIFCGFQAISVASSIISMINTGNIIKNGTSKYSDTLETLIRSLSWELERIENL